MSYELKIHGTSNPGQFLTGNLNFYTIRTTLDIRPSADKDPHDPAQSRLDKLVAVISTRAQPIILGGVQVTTEPKSSVTDLPAASAVQGSDVTVYTIRFAIEHNQAWEVNGNNPNLAETLNGVEGFVHAYPTTDNNVAVATAVLL